MTSRYGLRLTNSSSQLTVTADSFLPFCIGRTATVSVNQPTGSASASSPGRRSGNSIHTIDWAGPVIFAFELQLNRLCGIKSVTKAGNTYTVAAYCGDTQDGFGFDTQYDIGVWAFGFAPTVAGAYGLALRNSANVLVADLSRPNLLFPRGVIDANGSNGAGIAIPSLTRPCGIGMASWYNLANTNLGAGQTRQATSRGYWKRYAAANVQLVMGTEQAFVYTDSLTDSTYYDAPGNLIVIEGALLP